MACLVTSTACGTMFRRKHVDAAVVTSCLLHAWPDKVDDVEIECIIYKMKLIGWIDRYANYLNATIDGNMADIAGNILHERQDNV